MSSCSERESSIVSTCSTLFFRVVGKQEDLVFDNIEEVIDVNAK